MRYAVVPFPEADWKALRSMMSMLVERASARALSRTEVILSNREKSAHERYLELVKFVESERALMADLFDDLRRSSARMALARMVHHGVIENEELAVFTKETRATLEMLMTRCED
jgi:hypothetical protein